MVVWEFWTINSMLHGGWFLFSRNSPINSWHPKPLKNHLKSSTVLPLTRSPKWKPNWKSIPPPKKKIIRTPIYIYSWRLNQPTPIWKKNQVVLLKFHHFLHKSWILQRVWFNHFCFPLTTKNQTWNLNFFTPLGGSRGPRYLGWNPPAGHLEMFSPPALWGDQSKISGNRSCPPPP